MSPAEIMEIAQTAAWFQRVGQFRPYGSKVAIRTLNAWAGYPAPDDENAIADTMEWLPTSREQPDPIGADLAALWATASPERKAVPMNAYREALRSLGAVAHVSRLTLGPHDFSVAAHGAALYAVRSAAREAVVGAPGIWCELLEIYRDGYWPCGVLPDRRIVVF